MSFKDLFTREKNVVLYGQSARFRIVKYAILIPIFAAIYWWWGMLVTLKVLAFLFMLAIAGHFFYRWKTKGWREAWGGYKPPLVD
jgi:hypothetical protein